MMDTAAMMNQMWQKDEAMATNYRMADELSKIPARGMIKQCGIMECEEDMCIMDNACGPAVITEMLCDMMSEEQKERMQITACDFSPAMCRMATKMMEQRNMKNCKVVQADMMSMPMIKDNMFNYHITNFGYPFAPDAKMAMCETMRVMKPGGMMACTTWQKVGWMDVLRKCCASMPGCPAIPEQKEMFRMMQSGNEWENPKFVEKIMKDCGFENICINSCTNTHKMPRDAYMKVFCGDMMKAVLSTMWSKEDMDMYCDQIPAAMEKCCNEMGMKDMINMEMTCMIVTAMKPCN